MGLGEHCNQSLPVHLNVRLCNFLARHFFDFLLTKFEEDVCLDVFYICMNEKICENMC